MITYKLVRCRRGLYYPLFVETDRSMPLGNWLDAQVGELLDDDGPALRLQVNLSQQDALRSLQTVLSPSEYTHRLNALEREADALRFQIAGSADRITEGLKRACRQIPANAKWNQVEHIFMEQVESVTIWSGGKMEFRFKCGINIVSQE